MSNLSTMRDSTCTIKPKLRWPLEIKRHQVGSDDLLVITCPIGITPEPLVLVGAVAPLLGAFEGLKSMEEIAAQFAPLGLERTLLDELISLLDSHYLLENDRFLSAQEKLREDFRQLKQRSTAFSGILYATEPAQLRRELDQFLSIDFSCHVTPRQEPLATLVSPHIDFRRGGSCYGKAFNYLRHDSADIYILIGTAHQYSDHLFHLSNKDFLTPLNTLSCDTEFVRNLAQRYGESRSFADEILHKKEHSLELQTPFIAHIKANATIVPILVGGFHPMVASGKEPTAHAEYDEFTAALAETIIDANRNGKRVTFIAGVDMAHVGRHFGDKQCLSEDFLKQVKVRDQEYLSAIASNQKRKLFEHIAEDNDARKICGFPTMYTILDVAERLKWQLSCDVFDYQQAVDLKSDCAVTFAALGLYHSLAAR